MTTLARSGQTVAAVAGRLERGVRPHSRHGLERKLRATTRRSSLAYCGAR
jgi:hypothetical protein